MRAASHGRAGLTERTRAATLSVMARLRPGVPVLPLLLLAARSAHALTYTVAPGGDDQNPGTTAQPFKTLQRAADLVAADDTVHVEPGTYVGFSVGYDHLQTGFQDSPIIFLAKPGVVIDAPNANTPDGIDIEGADYVVIDGFEVHGVARAGIRVVSGKTNNVGVTISNNDSHDNGMWGIFTSHIDSLLIESNRAANSQMQHGIYVSNACVSPVVRGNELSGNALAGLHMNGDLSQGGTGVITGALVEKNVIHDNGLAGASGINCDGVQSSRIRNNLIYAEHASGISLYQIDAAKPSTDDVVVNNTVVVASDGRWALNIQNGSTGSTVLDNILLDDDPQHGSIDISADSLMGFTSDYNIVQSPFTADGTTLVTFATWQGAGHDANSRVAAASALFVNAAGGDYHLLPTAPAVGAGTTTDAPADDLDGTPRAGQDDIGAYQQCCRADGGVDAGADAVGAGGPHDGAGDAGRADAADARGDATTDGAPSDGGPRGSSDAGGAKAGAASGGCGCATARGRDGSEPARPALLVVLLLAGATFRRRPNGRRRWTQGSSPPI
jgi:hypothetical protein